MEELITVVVPVYNVEQYLERCIKSLLNQTYKNIEVILIDDGSQDNSPMICDSYSATYANIKVIHQKNAGVSAVRNTGIRMAQGEWICFVDSDDYISEVFFQEMMNLCMENSCDCAVCHYVTTSQDTCKFEISKAIKLFSGFEAVVEQFGNSSDILTLPCCKLYRRFLFDGVFFPEGKINEDVFTTHELLYRSKLVVLSASKLYAYFQSPSSIMRSGFSRKRLDVLEAYRSRIAYYENLDEMDIVNITRRAYCNRLFDAYWVCKRLLPGEKELYLDLRDKGKKEYALVKRIRYYIDMSNKRYWLMRLKQFLGRYLPRLYRVVFVKNKNYI